MDTNKAVRDLETASNALSRVNEALTEAKNSLKFKGKVLWVNVFTKGNEFYYTGSETFETQELATLHVGKKNTNFLRSVPVDLGFDYLQPETQYTSLAAMDWQQQDALLEAAKLYFMYVDSNKISVIKFIRGISRANLLESKQLVEYAIALRESVLDRGAAVVVPPTWFKQKP